MYKAFVDTNVLLRYLTKDNDVSCKACEKLLEKASRKEIVLYVLPVAVMEMVWVLEKHYLFSKKKIRELIEAIINTPELRVEMQDVFMKALKVYEEKNIKFADALMGRWGIDKGLATVYTYDVKDFKRIEGLEVRKP